MSQLVPFVDLLVRTALLLAPLGVAALAVRRLLLSRSDNVWLYAVAAIYGTVGAIGLLPWSFGGVHPSALFLVMAVLAPPVWLAVVVIADLGRPQVYEPRSGAGHEPLLLTDPLPATGATPVFRHRPSPYAGAPDPRPSPSARAGARTLAAARAMRGNASSDARRRPAGEATSMPGEPHLPFLTR